MPDVVNLQPLQAGSGLLSLANRPFKMFTNKQRTTNALLCTSPVPCLLIVSVVSPSLGFVSALSVGFRLRSIRVLLSCLFVGKACSLARGPTQQLPQGGATTYSPQILQKLLRWLCRGSNCFRMRIVYSYLSFAPSNFLIATVYELRYMVMQPISLRSRI